MIYVLLGVFLVFQALPSDKGKTVGRIGWLFILSCVMNIVWLFLWQFEYLSLSIVLMFLLFASLLIIYLRLEIGKSSASLRERLAARLAFSAYLGWITIASIANLATALVSVSWDGFGIGAETWAILVIVVALMITALVVLTRRDVAYGLVVILALVGIWVKQNGNQNLVLVAQISEIIVAVILVATVLLVRFKPQRQSM